jgi:hypothetical protein
MLNALERVAVLGEKKLFAHQIVSDFCFENSVHLVNLSAEHSNALEVLFDKSCSSDSGKIIPIRERLNLSKVRLLLCRSTITIVKDELNLFELQNPRLYSQADETLGVQSKYSQTTTKS